MSFLREWVKHSWFERQGMHGPFYVTVAGVVGVVGVGSDAVFSLLRIMMKPLWYCAGLPHYKRGLGQLGQMGLLEWCWWDG
jgi:hypothetical protein